MLLNSLILGVASYFICDRYRESQQLRGPYSVGFYQIWYNNMPHKEITDLKSDQGWMIQEDDYFKFPGGGTMFPEGADGYVRTLQKYIPLRSNAIRTALDIGCGVWSSYYFSFPLHLLHKSN